MIRGVLQEHLSQATKGAGYEGVEPEVLPTTDPRFGDYYSTIALKLAKAGGKQTS